MRDPLRGPSWAQPRRAGFVLLSAILGALWMQAPCAWAAPSAPPVSQSYYEVGFNGAVRGLNTRLYNQGRKAGRRGIRQVVFLAFGAPRPAVANPTTRMQQLFGYKAPAITLGRIRAALEEFSRGYHNGWQTPRNGSITIAWGTNNGKIPSVWSQTVTEAWGNDFAAAVRAYRDWTQLAIPKPGGGFLKTTYNRQRVVAGIDIEQAVAEGWNDYPLTAALVRGYESFGAARAPLINFGSNEIGNCTSPCGHGSWTTGRLVELSRGPGNRTLVCPQIYVDAQIQNSVTGGWVFTQRWADLNGNGRPLLFYCVMSTGRPPTYLTPEAAWQRFYDALSNVEGRNYSLRYVQRRLTHIKFASYRTGL
jgi:hypothetical protein